MMPPSAKNESIGVLTTIETPSKGSAGPETQDVQVDVIVRSGPLVPHEENPLFVPQECRNVEAKTEKLSSKTSIADHVPASTPSSSSALEPNVKRMKPTVINEAIKPAKASAKHQSKNVSSATHAVKRKVDFQDDQNNAPSANCDALSTTQVLEGLEAKAKAIIDVYKRTLDREFRQLAAKRSKKEDKYRSTVDLFDTRIEAVTEIVEENKTTVEQYTEKWMGLAQGVEYMKEDMKAEVDEQLKAAEKKWKEENAVLEKELEAVRKQGDEMARKVKTMLSLIKRARRLPMVSCR
jgi:hypothetical protein